MLKFRNIRVVLSGAKSTRASFAGPASASLVLLTSVIITGITLTLKHLGWFQSSELAAYDSMVRLQPEAKPDSRLLIVGITESDIQKQKSWPLSDLVVAQLLENLQKHQPRVIGLDLYRDIPHPPGTAALQQQLQADNVVAIYEIGDGSGVLPPSGVPENRLGFNDLLLDPDNVLRRNLLYSQSASGAQKIYSFALQVSLRYLSKHAVSFTAYPHSLQIGQTVLSRLKSNAGGYQMAPMEAQGWQTLRQYRSRKIAPQITLTQALTSIDPSLIRNKAVLIGTTAPSEKDIFLSPYSATLTGMLRVPGVEAHARSVSQILGAVLDNTTQFWFWSEWGEGFWIWGWSLVGGVLVWRIHRPLLLGAGLLMAVIALGGICFGLFLASGWVPVAAPAVALITTGSGVLAYKFFDSFSYDSLTGLSNRRRFIRQLRQQECHRYRPTAIIIITLNRFKVINDSLGHQAGDRLLVMAAERLRTCLPNQVQLARVGNNEFALCLNAVDEIEAAIDVANRVQTEISAPFPLPEQDVYTSASIGVAYSYPGSSGRLTDLLQHAHIAMYRGKALGKQRPEVFVTRMHDQTRKRWQLETDLRQALEQQEFELYYQPIINLKTGRISGVEALIRWRSPKRGFVVPSEFIPIAEETGLIIPIGQQVLRLACHQMKQWHRQFPHSPPLTISVNLSPRQFAQPELLKQVQQTIAEVGLDSRSLKLEITESMVTEDLEGAIVLLKQLKALNLKLSIDDFGTGYSSLSTLHRFPIDTLKIDKSFVCRMEEDSQYTEIVKTIIVLGHNLGMEIIAEGIETASQMKMLQVLSCEYGQGYFFAKPLSNEAATELIAQEPQWLSDVL